MTPITTGTHAAAADHDHVITTEDAFDFLNTLELERGALTERLTAFDDAASWLIARRVVHGAEAFDGLTESERTAALGRVRSARDALREIADSVVHARPPEPSAVATVNRTLASRERLELVPAEDGVTIGHAHVGDPVDDALARLAEPVVREIAAGHTDRVRICENDTCRWIFYDESRSGQRRWCDMATCGNRAKARRHRERLKAESAPA